MANENSLIGLANLSSQIVTEVQEGVGGLSAFVAVDTIRNSTSYLAQAGGASISGTYQIPNGVARLIITSQPNAATIQLPLSPTDGQCCEVINGTAGAFSTNVVTINVAAGPTLVGGAVTITTLAAGTSIEFQYSLANNTWYRVR